MTEVGCQAALGYAAWAGGIDQPAAATRVAQCGGACIVDEVARAGIQNDGIPCSAGRQCSCYA